MESFTDALKQRNLEKIRVFPKSDLHNHFVLGGSRQYLHKMTGIKIEPVKTPILSMDEMHAWNRENLGERFETSEMRKLLIRAAFHQAREELELHEVQHGISAIHDESVVRFLADHHIRLNITSSSNILLGRIHGMSGHPIGRFYRSGVDVTINSDDILIFDSDVSKEYLRLYESGCLSAEELDSIRQNGLIAR